MGRLFSINIRRYGTLPCAVILTPFNPTDFGVLKMNSTNPNFGELKTLNPRIAWPNEARDFTPWLAAHITTLGEVLEMQLELTGTETRVGDFSLDILAKDLNSDRQVIIENQFGSTNHDHLGKLLTYAAGLDATAVIWIAEEIREAP